MSKFPSFFLEDIIEIRAKPKSSKSVLEFEEGKVIAFLKSIPDEGKANTELVKLFKKQLGLKVEIVYGFKGKDKRVKVL